MVSCYIYYIYGIFAYYVVEHSNHIIQVIHVNDKLNECVCVHM